MVVVTRVVEDHLPHGGPAVAVRSHGLGDLVLLGLAGLAGFFRPRRQTDITDVNTLLGQVTEGLLKKREQDRIATLWPQTPSGLPRLWAPQTREEVLAVGLERRHRSLIDVPVLA